MLAVSGSSKQHEVIDLTLDSSDEEEDDKLGPCTPVTITPGPSHTSEASNSSSCVSPTVINLDAPTPSPNAISCHSLSASPAPMVVSSSQSASQSPFPSPGASPAPSTVPPLPTIGSFPLMPSATAPPLAHAPSYQLNPQPAHRSGPLTSFSSGSVLGGPPPLTTPTGLLVQGPGTAGLPPHLPMGPINLEALSEAEFEEFLHGLSWGV